MRYVVTFVVVILSLHVSAYGAVVETFTDKSAWVNATGQVTTIDFTGHGHNTPVLPDDFTQFGVTIVGAPVAYWHTGFFQNDGEGIKANNNTLFAHFDEPQHAIAVDYPGEILFKLYLGDELLYSSGIIMPPGIAGFAGLTSDMPFDRVLLYRTESAGPWVYIDDLHFSAIPAPGALTLLSLAALGARRRRRRGGSGFISH